MAYGIIGLILLAGVGWGVFMARTKAGADRAAKFSKPNYRGGVRRFTHGGPRIESDEQRSELIMRNRERYDPTIDRLDPRHKDYQERGGSPPAED